MRGDRKSVGDKRRVGMGNDGKSDLNQRPLINLNRF